jgi:hypothetical protein
MLWAFAVIDCHSTAPLGGNGMHQFPKGWLYSAEGTVKQLPQVSQVAPLRLAISPTKVCQVLWPFGVRGGAFKSAGRAAAFKVRAGGGL